MKDSQDELEEYFSAGKPAPKNFGEAFNQARKAGKDTFYYKGKLYSTELAGSKTPASSPSPSPSPAASKTSTQAERATKYKEDTEEKQRATSEAIRKGEEESQEPRSFFLRIIRNIMA